MSDTASRMAFTSPMVLSIFKQSNPARWAARTMPAFLSEMIAGSALMS